ncbi:hypothetical protein NM208_g16805 [Fusarium decemcellulare]|uniref:Uncharacterized protein n=1 Tax=Fusarium decemcellulare TaxID=57161 RepID=A0ACC1R952_9HYPO|nr:hypothetical protein NM208_g16805 [Fusarium decemcellulare]
MRYSRQKPATHYIFRLQFHYYVDAPDLGGRGWLFWLLTRSAPLRHAALTLSAYHQHLTSHYRTEQQEAELLHYHTQALQELRQVLCRRGVAQSKTNREDWVEFVAAGLFLISFEVFQGGIDNWETHLNALVSVGSELSLSDLDPQSPDLQSPDVDYVRGMRTAEEFMMVNILWFDLLSCVSTAAAPRAPYHEWIESGNIDLSRVMGCQNSTMLAIGDIATLEAQAASMDSQSLQHSISELEQRILQFIQALESDTQPTPTTRSVTRLFLRGALVQIYTIAAEYNLTAPEPREAVDRVIDAIDRMDKDLSLRGVPWVLCVAGSIALPTQQPIFENALLNVLNQSASGFTNCGTVLRIIKHAWSQQSLHPDQMWTARRAMADLGISALLI